MPGSTKTCNECRETKPATEFYKGNAKCKPCYNERQRKREAAKRGGGKAAKAQPAPEPEPAFTPADEDLDLPDEKDVPEKAADPHWCISELRDPRLSTIEQARKILDAKFGDVGLEDTAEVLAQFADLDLT